MNLFLKIFLWFLAAIALMVGMVVFLNWTVQTEPVVSRWRNSITTQMTIYAATAAQVHDKEGEMGLNDFLDRIRNAGTVSEVSVIGSDGALKYGIAADLDSYRPLAAKSFESGETEIETIPLVAIAGKKYTLNNGSSFVLVLRWERPQMTPFFGESPLRFVRFGVLIFAAFLLCWALARYLSSPIGKIRRATRKLADGDLKTRVADEIGNRRDELAELAVDFDVMAERIESLINSQKRLSRDVSHELRSPLARMNVALEIAKQKSNGDIAPMLDRIDTESRRLNEMISSLLTLSKLETGSQDFEKYDVDLKELLEDIASDADFEAKANGRSVKIIEADKCSVTGSETLLQSAIENVLRNAVRYTTEGTTVEVSLKSIGDKAYVKIRDFGGGVPEDEIGNLFRPFYRVGEARERKTGGIGLGLAIAEQAIKAHKGTIHASNTDDGLIVEIALTCNGDQILKS
ncbi:MAG: HAMP domain-containing protein [Saprospiraceae bacterium]|nr:HAMP domain-containing protein [Pyrinomonadaceae bacterium]